MRKNNILIRFALIFMCTLMLVSCNQGEQHKKEVGPEVGKWHAEIKLSDISDSMSDEDKTIMAMLAGNIMFEIDAEFGEDNSFTYVMNTDQLQKSVSDSVSTLIGFFFDFDVSLFTDRIVEAALQDALHSSKQDYAGTYTRSESNLITATDGETLYFKVNGTSLTQIDEEGNTIIRFSKVS